MTTNVPEAYHKRVVVKPATKDNKTKSGILLSSDTKEAPMEGTIVSVGSEVGDGLRAGDRVVHKKYNCDDVTVDGEKYKLMDHENVLCIIERAQDGKE